MMRSPSITTAASATGVAPVPSISVPPVRTRIMLRLQHAPDLRLRPEDRVLRTRRIRDGLREHVGNDVAIGDQLDALVGRRRPAVEMRVLRERLERLVLRVQAPHRMALHVAPDRMVVVVARHDPLVVLRRLEEPAQELTGGVDVLAGLPDAQAAWLAHGVTAVRPGRSRSSQVSGAFSPTCSKKSMRWLPGNER